VKWSWPGATAFVLALTLGGGWCVGVILAGTPPSIRAVGTQNGIDMLTAVGGVLAGALATYVGASITQGRRDARDEVHEEGDDTGQEAPVDSRVRVREEEGPDIR
jgi:hypothetical protein